MVEVLRTFDLNTVPGEHAALISISPICEFSQNRSYHGVVDQQGVSIVIAMSSRVVILIKKVVMNARQIMNAFFLEHFKNSVSPETNSSKKSLKISLKKFPQNFLQNNWTATIYKPVVVVPFTRT